jgi:PIN like domain
MNNAPTETDYRRLLTDGIVVPDANVFLNLYRYNEQTRNDLFAVLRGVGDRLWVPHQVLIEFWRNREAVLQDPRDTSITIKELASQRDKAIGTFRSWANRVSLRSERTAELTEVLTQAFTAITSGVSELADNNASDFARDTNQDPVLQKLEPIMRGRVGAGLSKDERAEAIAEAKLRADSKTPPGYKDSGKDLIASAGDYLVWHQTMRQAELEKRDVLFITGDVKEDWSIIQNPM